MLLHESARPADRNQPEDSSPRAGLGRCSRCGCPSFQGQGNYCEDCGHPYDDHNTGWLRTGVAVPVSTVEEVQCPEAC
jgi:hypothetical protein